MGYDATVKPGIMACKVDVSPFERAVSFCENMQLHSVGGSCCRHLGILGVLGGLEVVGLQWDEDYEMNCGECIRKGMHPPGSETDCHMTLTCVREYW